VSKAYQQEKEAAAKRAAAEVEAIKSRLTQNQLTLKASAKGLQLDGPRTYSYPQIRAIELQTEITDLQKEIADLNREIEGNQADLARVSQELNTQHQVTVKVPQNGVIWSIDAQPGEALSANDPILQLIDCQNVWVEAFINEKEAASLSVGQSVDVHLIGTDTVLPGKLQTLRAGTGRVTVGQNVVDPPPEIERRQLPVRVVTARIQVDWPEPPSPENFCRAGRSVEVRTTKEI
jgi:multidrug resistance efflux pump